MNKILPIAAGNPNKGTYIDAAKQFLERTFHQ